MRQTPDERNEDLLVNVNGELVHRDEAGVSPFDSVVQGGDAVWEGLRLYDGTIFRLHDHLKRLRSSAKALAFDEIPWADYFIDELRRTLEANEMRDDVHIRLTLTRGEKVTSGMDPRLNQSGPTLIILPEYKTPVYDKSGLAFVSSSIRRFPPDCLDPKIHHNNLLQSILAKIEANHAGADAALMLDRDGFIAEGHGTHVFIVDGETVVTGPTDACPEGITRQTVLDLCARHDIDHEVRPLSVTEAYRADEMFCSGTMGELAGITELDGRTIGDGTIGTMTERLSALYAEETASEGYPIFDDGNDA
jgi:branched-chain amino acid aminotransferase